MTMVVFTLLCGEYIILQIDMTLYAAGIASLYDGFKCKFLIF